jgi:hypothetical protein
MGRHVQGFPTASLKGLIAKESLFRKLGKGGFKVTFANAFTPPFFENRPHWLSTTTVMCETAGVRLRKLEELVQGKSLFMDFTNHFLRDRGYEVPVRLPGEAAEILASLSREYDLCLYEYFLTDIVGHRGDFKDAVDLLRELDHFLWKVVERVDLTNTSVLITSDHGNIEDMRNSLHTANRVPTLLWGDIKKFFSSRQDELSLDQITPLLVQFFLSSRVLPGQ